MELHHPALVVVVPAPLRAYDFSTLNTVGSRVLSHCGSREVDGIGGWSAPKVLRGSCPRPCNCSRNFHLGQPRGVARVGCPVLHRWSLVAALATQIDACVRGPLVAVSNRDCSYRVGLARAHARNLYIFDLSCSGFLQAKMPDNSMFSNKLLFDLNFVCCFRRSVRREQHTCSALCECVEQCYDSEKSAQISTVFRRRALTQSE